MQNGMLPLQVQKSDCQALADDAEAGLELEVDLEKQEVRRMNGQRPIAFTIDPFRRHCLLNGLDDIALTLQKAPSIEFFEERRTQLWPWLDGFGYKGGRVPVAPVKKSIRTEW
jgi:3-isopropylmalate dehydratase